MNKLEMAARLESIIGEGPCWDDRSEILYWIDILGKKIYCLNPYTNMMQTYKTNQFIGCLALRRKSGLICALQDGIYGFNPMNGLMTGLLPRPDGNYKYNRFNDGKCDPAGRLFVGTMSNLANNGKGGDNNIGTLYQINKDWQVKEAVSNVTISNGLAWSPDYKKLYYIDSPTREISVFDYYIETGEIANRRVAIDFRSEAGIPDGMTIDEEGLLWIAHWGGWKVSCWNPANGRKHMEINLPCQNVSCCTFGSRKLDTLYITTAREGLDLTEMKNQPEAGSLFAICPGSKGLRSYRFEG